MRYQRINLQGIPDNLVKEMAAINVPFPALTSLQLSSEADNHERFWEVMTLIFGESFLGGTAPRLRSLDLRGISFPAPQKLLLSATDLVTLRLEHILLTGYIEPEDVVTFLSTLTKLKEFALGFQSKILIGLFLPKSRPLVPSTVLQLPALTSFRFRGDDWYLEALITQISLPLLDSLDVTLLSRQQANIPPLREFISDIETRHMHDRADISFTVTLST